MKFDRPGTDFVVRLSDDGCRIEVSIDRAGIRLTRKQALDLYVVLSAAISSMKGGSE